MTGDQTEEPYELNTTWWSAINDDRDDKGLDRRVKRYIASRSIALVIRGVPGIYIHGAAGTVNDYKRVEQTGVKRDVNRGFICREEVERALLDPSSKLSLLRHYDARRHHIRTRHRAFHPRGSQKITHLTPEVFALVRSAEGDEHILAMTNVTGREIRLRIPLSQTGVEAQSWHDLLSERPWEARQGILDITLESYGVLWLRPQTS
jgi:sucrose phosphorylase